MRFIFFFLFPFIVFSQNISEKQRLLNVLDTSSIISEKVQLYVDLAWEYTIIENDSALIYAEIGLILSKKNKYKLGEAISLEAKGLYEEIVTGNYDLASEYYFEGIKLSEENNLAYATSIYHSLGVMFHTSDNFEKAKEYYTIAYEKAKSENNILIQKKCLINLGAIYSTLKEYQKAEEMLLESLTLDIRKDYDYSTYANLGNLYYRKKEYQKALPYLELATEQGQDNLDSEGNLYFLINVKAALKDSIGMDQIMARATIFIEESVSARTNSLMLMAISNYYRKFGELELALEYRDKYLTIYEEIKEGQRDQTVYELETKYQTEKVQRDLEKEQAAQKLLYFILGFTGILLVLISFFFYKNRKNNILLAKQKKMLEITVDEKNVLLKETHHRVKNSFQIVSSLLYLQSESITDKEAQNAIKEAQNRVRSMVLIHQKLYSKDQLVGIDTNEYISDLVNDIMESHQFQKHSLAYTLDIEPLILNVETITPIGLIINELIVNVLKHAFNEIDENSLLTVSLKKKGEELILQIQDNGKGLQEKVKETSFGIKLIKALSKKLKGNLKFDSQKDQGTLATLTIKRFNIL